MSRIRSIHPGLASDEAYMSMSMAAKAAWPLLWTECDDHGVFEWKPIVLKARIFPADNVDFAAILAEMEALGSVMRFESVGRSYGVVRNFCKYQRPKYPSFRHPFPDAVREFVEFKEHKEDCPPPALPQPSPSPTEKPPQMKEEVGEEKKERAKPSVSSRGTRWNKGQKVPDEWKSWAVRAFPGVDRSKLGGETRQFEDYWPGKPGKDGLKLDWEATYRNWLRKAFPGHEVESGALAKTSRPPGWPSNIPDPEAAYLAWSNGHWPGAWGYPPDDPACSVPTAILAEWKQRRIAAPKDIVIKARQSA